MVIKKDLYLMQVIIKEGFIISSKMLKDHLCDSVTTALEGSIERLKPMSNKADMKETPQRDTTHPPEENSSDSDSE